MKTLVIPWREWANRSEVRDRLPPGQPAIITHEGRPRYLVIRLDQPAPLSADQIEQRAKKLGLPNRGVNVLKALQRES